MDGTKVEEILQKLFNETNDLLDEKFAVMAAQIRNDINEVKEDLARYKAENNIEIEKLKKTVSDVETSQEFLTDDESIKRVNNLIDNNKKMHLENQRLNVDIKDLKTQLQQSKDELNLHSQYIRSSWMVEISGILVKKDENLYNIISKIIDLAGIENFSVDQIVIAHRTSTNHFAPIIILFKRKRDRINFYSQKGKLRKLIVDQVLADREIESNSIE